MKQKFDETRNKEFRRIVRDGKVEARRDARKEGIEERIRTTLCKVLHENRILIKVLTGERKMKAGHTRLLELRRLIIEDKTLTLSTGL
jgi:hypothetical protein